ncbi:uncharacterized protein LOC114879783 [Osmia bicornis bicornis]|uniref:uncharacterized protein LOC114879783 n=1 Tax=Osmia bicornis bicornis TaxID=1437191 RepID=UPI001EAF2FB1|nr:uncharacterized protein LOC114879783 [Osmia bicornis bicornis]
MEWLRILLVFGSAVFVLAHVSMDDYLDERLKQTKIEIAKLYFRNEPSVQRKVYNVKWDKSWQQDIGKKRPFTVNAFNKVLLIEENYVLTLSFDEPPSNQTLPQEITSTRNDKSITFVRSIVWKSVLYLLICYETGSCSLYTGTDNLQLTIRHRQSIQHKGYPMDASFFVRANRLYLVVANNSGKFAVPSLIYHWRGTYMDVEVEVITIAAVSVTTFKHKQSTILVFAQNDMTVPDIGSMVYEFKEISLDRIQFLSTLNPVSVHHYNHAGFDFIFFMNGRSPSSLFWWDGHELLNWEQILEIKASSLFHVLNIKDDTFFFVGHNNTLQLYKFENASDRNLLSSMKLPNEKKIIDVQIQAKKSTITMMLVIMNEDNTYVIESWELRVEEIPSDYSIKESDILSEHLAELVETLQQRTLLIEKAESSWPSLFPADKDLTITEPLILPSFKLDFGTVENIDVFAAEDVITPDELRKKLDILIRDVNDTLTTSKNLLISNNTNLLNEDILVDGDAFIGSLQIDKMNVDHLNGFDMNSKDIVNSNKTQESLRGKNIVVDNVEIDSICGIPFQYWALNDGTSKTVLDRAPNNIEFSNDTMFLYSNVSMESLNLKTLNDIDIDEFFSELFVINKNQKIKGNVIYNDVLQIQNLTTETLNGEPFENYMTTSTDQHFDSFIIKSLKVDDLYADSINDVPVSEAARISTEAVIKGVVKIARLQITDKLTADLPSELTKSQPHQIYSNVTVYGNVNIGTLDMDKYAVIFLNNEKLNLNNIFETFWTKSTDQTFENSVTFENNLIIDRLQTKYLNGFLENEFFYTNATTIPESFKSLHFENVHIDDMFFTKEENNNFFDIAPESLTIQDKLYLKHLHTNQLFTQVYNNLSVTDILNGKPSVFPENMHFSTVRAKRVNILQGLELLFLNDTDTVAFLGGARSSEGDQKEKFIKTLEFHVENLNVDRINDIDMKKLLSLKNMKISDLRNLIIDGDLTVKGDLKIDRIHDESAATYLRNMLTKDIVFYRNLTIDELIVQNATLEFLNGINLNNLFDDILLKSKKQVVPGKFSFYKIATKNINSKFINDKDTSELKWIDDPLFLVGNVAFENLFVEGDVVTKILNGRDVNELYNNLLNLSVISINNLQVHGNITWSNSSMNPSSLTFFLKNAMTKTSNQSILGDIVFENDVSASKVKGEYKAFDEIRDIVADTVIDDGDIIRVAGQKVFKQNLITDSLLVTDDVSIPMINNISILKFNNSVVKKDQNETITMPINFLHEVTIKEVLTNDTKVHDAPLEGLVLATDMLPRVTFKSLVVLKDVYLKNLDGVYFDKFMKNRITTDGDHDIFVDVQFNSTVEITGNTNVTRINGINPSNLVLDGMEEAQLISNSKIFEEDVVVHGNIYTKSINNVDISLAYSNGIQTDQDVEITGDLILKSPVKVPQNVFVSKLINGINLYTVLDDVEEDSRKSLQMFTRNETIREESIRDSTLITSTLRNIFSYIEEEERLKIQVPNIKKIDVINYEEITKINMFGEKEGSACGLPDDCPCPTEYIAELTKEDCRIRKMNDTRIVRNYHERNNIFGVNIITNAISSSRECVSNRSEDEFVTISWMKSGLVETGDVVAKVTEISPQIHGLIKDAEVFMAHDNTAFVVLAIYYNTLLATHRTNSLIYKIDFEKNVLLLHQELYTDGAWAIEIFRIDHHTYVLLGCFGDSETSVLYKLDAPTYEFIMVRAFGGKTRNVKSLHQEKDHFILLDEYDTNALNIFHYDSEFDNFYDYQSLFHDSRVEGIECFYSDEYGQSDSFVIVTTENDQLYIYEYMFAQKFQMKVYHQMDDLQMMVPFDYLGNYYVFAGTSKNSTILRIIQQGPH